MRPLLSVTGLPCRPVPVLESKLRRVSRVHEMHRRVQIIAPTKVSSLQDRSSHCRPPTTRLFERKIQGHFHSNLVDRHAERPRRLPSICLDLTSGLNESAYGPAELHADLVCGAGVLHCCPVPLL